ncbi:MAG: carboxylesterase/lipase family protein [Christensenellaceae bacterium]|nr:carboxylesterase/lipase family protein [Christensenellaceae bacterium]
MFIKKLTTQVICSPDEAIAKTKQGKLRGLISDGTYIFRGVKYADAERFHLPEKPASWEGIKDAIIYGTVCPEVETVIPHDQFNVPHVFYPQDENCQYLNIWTQNLDENAKKPVMVWLHGGGYATGSGIEHFAYDGENMSREGDVVVVTLNHRLNILGFLNLSAYGEEYQYSGNLGMADLVAALEWVRENISAFGGDPENVTIFGQSGGGGKVATLLQMPSADGLYHKAIIQSGTTRNFLSPSWEESIKVTEEILKNLGITKENIKEIEKLPYYKLAQAVKKLGPGAAMGFGPIADGSYYLGDIYEAGMRDTAKKIPLMVGSILGEFSGNFNRSIGDNRKITWDAEKRIAMIREAAGDKADALIAAFKTAYPEKNIADVLFTDTMFRVGALDYAKERAKYASAPTFNYLFTLEAPFYGGTVPWHNAEIPYVFHNADYLEASYMPGISEWLQDIICHAWTNFAKNGYPTAVGMPEWKAFSENEHNTMIFDEEIVLKKGHDAALMEILPQAELKMTSINRSKAAGTFGGGPRV